jgi:hypothetical protein
LAIAKSASSGYYLFLQFHASLFGYMASKFKKNFVDLLKDNPPSLFKTVTRVIDIMKDLFFKETHDNIRNALALSFHEIIDNCFNAEKVLGKS